MADPDKLVAGAAAVYGANEVRRMYGEILPIDATRIIEAPHETRIDLAGRELLCLDTGPCASPYLHCRSRQQHDLYR